MTAYSDQYRERRRRATVSLSLPETEILLTVIAAGRMTLEADDLLRERALADLERAVGKLMAANGRLSAPGDRG